MTLRRLDRLVDLQQRVVTRDDFGSEVETWADVETVWARVRQTGVREQHVSNADREQASRNAVMRIRYREDVAEAQHRVVYNGQPWDIIGIDEVGYRRFLDLTVQALVTGVVLHPTGLTLAGGLSDDNVPETAELTIAGVGPDLAFPAFTDKHLLIWRLATEPDIMTVVLADDPTLDNQVAGFTKYATAVMYQGADGNVWVSNQLLTFADERTVEVA